METLVPGCDTVRVSKILIDRDKFYKNTIHVNPRLLKPSSAVLSRHKISCQNPSQGCSVGYINQSRSGTSDQLSPVIQSLQTHGPVHIKPNVSLPATGKCVYVNPHFQKSTPSTVYINPKKFSDLMGHSKQLLVHTQSGISEVPDSNVPSCSSSSASSHVTNAKCVQIETTTTVGVKHKNLHVSNKRADNFKFASAKPVNNTFTQKNNSYKLTRISDTKLIRMPDKTKSWCVNKTLQKVLITQRYQMLKKLHDLQNSKYNKKPLKEKNSSCTQLLLGSPLPSAVNRSTRYKLTRKASPVQSKEKSQLPTSSHCVPSKYKLDRRLVRSRLFRNFKKVSPPYLGSANILQRRSGVLKSFHIMPVACRGKIFSTRTTGLGDGKKIIISSRKLLRIGSAVKTKKPKKKEEQTSHSTRLVRIGDVLYKTSRTKLTKSKASEESIKQPIVKRHKTDRSQTIYIRGNKFIMDAKGKTLRQVPQKMKDTGQKDTKPVPMKRIDIGGFTFVQKSSDLLVRTNTHTARNILNHAKNKSIAMLTKKLRKNNQPCAFYRRFGKCSRRDKGTCQLVHDPKQIAVCKRFLQGECNIDNCPLSHQIVPEKMPTCKYFLEGCCVRENCPYTHVKLNSKAVICENFLKGYCADGSRCKKRHSYVCPNYEKLGTCRKGKYCPYPHKTGLKVNKQNDLNQAKHNKPEQSPGDRHRKRYYQEEENEDTNSHISEEGNKQKLNLVLQTEEAVTNDSQVQCALEVTAADKDKPVLKRPRIGRLPSFIAIDK